MVLMRRKPINGICLCSFLYRPEEYSSRKGSPDMLSGLIIIGTIASVLAVLVGWNIKERYFLYNKSQPIFEQYNNEFIAKIPLIKTEKQ